LPRARKKTKGEGSAPPSEKALLQLLKQHLQRDYPNPRRSGCPPEQSLVRLAERPLTGKSSIVRHLFHCSPCYRVYSRALHDVRKAKTTHSKKV
jgi:hypothetical protein